MQEKWKMYIPTVDVVIFCSGIMMSITMPANVNFNLQRICYYMLNNDRSECEKLGVETSNKTDALEADAQYVSNQISLVNQCTEAVITMLVTLMIGPWTDKFGRKPGLILTQIGSTLSAIYGIVFVAFEISPWYGLVGGLPTMLTGGPFAFMTVASSYLVDKTKVEDRGLRMAIFQTYVNIGIIGGTFLATPLLNATSYLTLNLMSGGMQVLMLLYVSFVLKESLKDVQKEGMIRGFFDLSNPKQLFQTTFKKRTGANRGIVLMITLVTALTTVIGGELMLRTLLCRKKFGWVMEEYNVFNGVDNIVTVVGTIGGTVLLTKVLHIRESICCLIISTLTLSGALVIGFATTDWEMYLSLILRMADCTIKPFTTTLLSRLVAQDEMGQILSGMAGVQFLCNLVSSPLYTEIYNETLSYDPAMYSFLTSTIVAVAIAFNIAIIVLERKYVIDTSEEQKVRPSSSPSKKASIRDIANQITPTLSLDPPGRKLSLIMP